MFAYPAAQEVLDRCRLGRGVRVGVVQGVGGGAGQRSGGPGSAGLARDRLLALMTWLGRMVGERGLARDWLGRVRNQRRPARPRRALAGLRWISPTRTLRGRIGPPLSLAGPRLDLAG